MAPCWFTLDPASLLATSHFQEGLPEVPAEFLAHEYLGDDVYTMSEVVRSAAGVTTLHEATRGDPQQSYAYREHMVPFGVEQEAVAGLRTAAGEVWGALSLYRQPGQALFSGEERDFLRAVSPSLAEGAKRALLIAEAVEPDTPAAPGLLVLTEALEVDSMTPGVERWLQDLPDGDWDRGRLPAVALSVAAQALRTADIDAPGEVAVARVLSRSGQWLVVHGASLVASGSRRVGVIIEPAHPARIAPILMAAYGLTEREQDVTRLALQGFSTTEIAGDLVVSTHTVQQHLKSVFDKTGVRSRRELVGKVFFSHYEGRLRDNERRTLAERPVRGGPVVGSPGGQRQN